MERDILRCWVARDFFSLSSCCCNSLISVLNLSINTLDYILYREVTENKANFEKCEFSDFYEFDNFYVINYWCGKNSICFVSKDLIKKDVIESRTDSFFMAIQEKY